MHTDPQPTPPVHPARAVTAHVTFGGFEPAAWLQLLIEHRIRSLALDDADLRGCDLHVTRTATGWDVALQVDAGTGTVLASSTTAGTRPKDALVPVRDAFARTRRLLARRAGRCTSPPVPLLIRVVVSPQRRSRTFESASGAGIG